MREADVSLASLVLANRRRSSGNSFIILRARSVALTERLRRPTDEVQTMRLPVIAA